MDWEHKGIRFTITTESMGPLCLASARTPQEGMFIRIRPFSAIGTSENNAVKLLKEQIKLEFLKIPDSETG